MKRSDGRILTTHTGSLPRPPALTGLYAARSRGEAVDPAELATAGRAAVRGVIARQAAAGVDIGNNGEQTREAFFLYVRNRLTGLGGAWNRPISADIRRYPEFQAAFLGRANDRSARVTPLASLPKAIGPVTYADPRLIRDEVQDLRAALDECGNPFPEAFVSSPSPGILATAIKNEHYDSQSAYLAALGEAMRTEYLAIVENGFLLQLDCPELALDRHLAFQDRPLSDFLDATAEVVETINHAIRGIPKDRVRLHVCWGNVETPHDADVALRDILPIVLRAKVGALVLPFANPRHAHEFKDLAKNPLAEDQLLIAGVIDTLTNFVEHPEVVSDRLERIAAVVGDPSRVLAGTDCGFDTSAGAGRVSPDVVFAKLTALRDGARLASDRLFGGG